MSPRLLPLGAVLCWMACGPGSVTVACGQVTPPPKDPPQVFVTVAESVIAAPTLSLKINVVGCVAVSELLVLQAGNKVKGVTFTGNPTEAVLQPSDFNTYYNPLGIAVGLTLSAKATCDDGRVNTSQPVGVRYFPVASTVERTDAPALPDSFVAEGGLGNNPVSFVGCIGTSTGTALARVNLAGDVVGVNQSLPFPCSYESQITDKNAATGHRWLLEPGRGVFSFDANLNIDSIANGAYTVMGVAPDGDAIIWDSKAIQTSSALYRVRATGGAFPANAVWGAQTVGILNATPVVDGLGTVFVASWAGTLGARQGSVVVQRFNYATGQLITPTYSLVTMEYGDLDSPEIPNGAFNTSGSVLYFPYQTNGPGVTLAQSRVIACATTAADCQGAAQRWISPVLDAVGLFAIPYAQNKLIAVVAAQATYFLRESDGQVVSFEGKPVTAEGSLFAHSVQPGLTNDFYILNGPAGAYPIEIIALDSPDRGELWRYQLAAGGEIPQTALYLAVDEAGQAWVRSGGKQIRPFSLTQYRDTKGANPPTP